ncbi:MAG: hypothetical protein ABIF77_20600, partial [bacterium]
MVKIDLRGLLLLGVLTLCGACSQNGMSPATNQETDVDSETGIAKRGVVVPDPLPILTTLTQAHMETVWDNEKWNRDESDFDIIRDSVNLVDGGVVSGIPASYPSIKGSTYECSVDIEAGSIQGGPGPSVVITIAVPVYEGQTFVAHPACFDIYTHLDVDLYFDPPATVTICEFHWADGIGAPPDFECVYRMDYDHDTEVWNYSNVQAVFCDPVTGSLTFPMSCIPGYGENFVPCFDRPDRGG